MFRDLYCSLPMLICFEGDDSLLEAEAAAEAAEAAAADAAAKAALAKAEAAAAAKAATEKTLTQAEMNKALAEDRRKHKAQLEKAEAQLKELSESKGLSDAQRAKAEEAREDILKTLRTKEENARIEKQKLEEQYQSEVVALKKRAEDAEAKFNESTIHRALMDAAVAGDAHNAGILVTVLRQTTKLDPQGVVKVDIQTKSAEGEDTTLQMSPVEAVKWMKERPADFGGLFNSNIVPGIGGSSGAGPMTPGKNGRVDISKLSVEQVKKLYKENPERLGM